MSQLLLGFGKDKQRVYINEETRSWHMHVIGSTGTGKSKFLEWMIRGDILAGNGLCLIDPHGDLYDEILQWCAYKNFLSDREIILLNPSEGDYVTGFNPFSQGEGEIDAQVNRRIQVTLKAWGMESSDQTPTLERWLRCIFWTLIEQRLSIVEAQYLVSLDHLDVLERLTARLSSSLIAAEWRTLLNDLRYARDPARASKDVMNELLSTRNRLFRLLTSPSLMNFMGQIDCNLNLAEIMDSGKILLVNLKPSDRLDDMNARLLGTLLVNQLYETVRRREREGLSSRPFYLYIDEFQNFATHDIDKILAEGRKMGLHLIMAHQDLSQVEEVMSVRTLLSTARTKVVFGGLNREDAICMVEEMFVHQLDLQEFKEAVTQTKFWPVYDRDQVTTKGRSSTTSGGHSSGIGSGSSWGSGSSRGASQADGTGFFGELGAASSFSSFSTSSGRSQSSMDVDSEGWADTESEAVADVPIYRPVPFEEATQTYTLEEQKWRMADNLKEQWARHCFIKIGNEKTQPMLVPLVHKPELFKFRLEEYRRKLMEKSPYCLPIEKARAAIEERQQRLLAAPSKKTPYPDDEKFDQEPQDYDDEEE